ASVPLAIFSSSSGSSALGVIAVALEAVRARCAHCDRIQLGAAYTTASAQLPSFRSGRCDSMRKLLVVWMLLLATGPVMGQELTETRQAAARATIDGVLSDRFIAGWNSHDAHLFASAFALDADFTNIRGEGASGRDNIEKFHAKVFERFFLHCHRKSASSMPMSPWWTYPGR